MPRRPPHCHVVRRPRLPSARCCRLRSSIARQREVENPAHMDAWATGRARCARVSRAYCARSRESRSHSETKGRYLRVPRRPPHCHVLRRGRRSCLLPGPHPASQIPQPYFVMGAFKPLEATARVSAHISAKYRAKSILPLSLYLKKHQSRRSRNV